MKDRVTASFLRRHGEAVTVRNYTQTGTDDYGDPTWDESTTETTAVVMLPKEPTQTTNASGETVYVDARFFVANESVVVNASDATPHPSVIDRHLDGESYRVELSFSQNNGLYRIETRRHDP